MAASKKASKKKPARISRPYRRRVVRLILLVVVLVGLLFALRPARIQWALRSGQQALSEADARSALESFEAARELAPDDPEIHFWLARAARKLGDPEGLRHHLDEARRLGFLNQNRLRNEWRLFQAQTGNVSAAEPFLANMLMDPDDSVEACEAFTLGYCLNLNFDRARDLIDAWEADHPEDYRPKFYRAQILAGNESWADGEKSYRAVLELQPDDARAKLGLAECLLEQRSFDEVKGLLDEVLSQQPDNVTALMRYARLAREQQDYSTAEEKLRRVVAVKEDHFEAQILLAKVLLASDQAEDAAILAQKLVNQWPDDLAAVYTLAQALRSVGKTAEAEKYFDHYAELGDVLGELERLKLEIQSSPSDIETRLRLGELVMAHMSREEGAAWLQSVLFMEPDHPIANQRLAEYYSRMGNTELAQTFQRRSDQSDSTESQGTEQD